MDDFTERKIFFYVFDGFSVKEGEGFIDKIRYGYPVICLDDGNFAYTAWNWQEWEVKSPRNRKMYVWGFEKDIAKAIDLFIEFEKDKIEQCKKSIEKRQTKIAELNRIKRTEEN